MVVVVVVVDVVVVGFVVAGITVVVCKAVSHKEPVVMKIYSFFIFYDVK